MTTPASLLHPDAFLSPLAIDEAVQRALDEDLGQQSGFADHQIVASVDGDQRLHTAKGGNAAELCAPKKRVITERQDPRPRNIVGQVASIDRLGDDRRGLQMYPRQRESALGAGHPVAEQ